MKMHGKFPVISWFVWFSLIFDVLLILIIYKGKRFGVYIYWYIYIYINTGLLLISISYWYEYIPYRYSLLPIGGVIPSGIPYLVMAPSLVFALKYQAVRRTGKFTDAGESVCVRAYMNTQQEQKIRINRRQTKPHNTDTVNVCTGTSTFHTSAM